MSKPTIEEIPMKPYVPTETQLDADLAKTRDLALNTFADATAGTLAVRLPDNQKDAPELMLRQIRFVLSYFAGLEHQKNEG